ncbi:hypothetical protein VTN02DRAFT_6847 [Thermoascus thermophilus]
MATPDVSRRARRTAPAFSLPLMTSNFRRFNARIGIVFVFQARLLRLLRWRRPAQTLSLLFVYSLVCLDPHLLVVLPLAAVLLAVMVPAFAARHPPPPSSARAAPYHSYRGPALAPPSTLLRPANETSKDFFRNLRDLQNSMADYADLHDSLVATLSPPTDFSDEKRSSTLFLLLAVATALLFLTAHLLPWRLLFLVGGNAAVLALHPRLQELLLRPRPSRGSDPAADPVVRLAGFSVPKSLSSLWSLLDAVADITLDSDPEERLVEIFELQYRPLSPYATAAAAASDWEHFLFSPTPYDPLSPARIAGDRPRGCRFFEDVQPPSGWAWKSKKWELDLDCREWVLDRMVTGVGLEVPGRGAGDDDHDGDGDGGGGGWVWDLPPDPPSPSPSAEEEAEAAVSSPGMGEWRRRRWVRVVQRVCVPTAETDQEGDTDRE